MAAAANSVNNSPVSAQAVNDDLYIQATPAAVAAYGSAGTNFSYSLSFASNDPTDFGDTGSFGAKQSSGVLDGSASQNAPGSLVYQYTVPQGGNDPVGNLTSYTDSVMGTFNFTTSGTGSGPSGYDTLNRLAAGTLTPPSTSSNPTPQSFCWSYDAFGNRTAQSISSQPFTNAAGARVCQPAGSAALLANTGASYNANNQITGSLINYDQAGDVTSDTNTGNTYLYDGEGRLCAVRSEPVGGTYSMTGYIYDADGARVSKGSISTWSCNPDINGFQAASDYILGPGGEQVTEMGMGGTTTTSSGATSTTSGMVWQHTNVYAAGALIATYDNDGLHFYFNDPLGSRRAQTDYAGVLEQTCSSLPFGDGLTCTGSVTTPTEQHFTGKERDAESGNDYFGARYYASTAGRWLSPDWSSKVEPVPYVKLTDPQSLNLYSYVGNNPLRSADLDGHDSIGADHAFDFMNCLDPQSCPATENPTEQAFKRYLAAHAQQPSQTQNTAAGAASGAAVGGAAIAAMPSSEFRRPDFISLNFNYAIANELTATVFGVTVAINLDRNGRLYIGAGPEAGKSLTLASYSVTANWMDQKTTPTSDQLDNLLSNFSSNGTAGFITGYQQTWTPHSGGWDKQGFATGFGIVSPQIGVSGTYSWHVFDFPFHW
jgi:RHS repeat-associated protein